jgi:hypothetical protein
MKRLFPVMVLGFSAWIMLIPACSFRTATEAGGRGGQGGTTGGGSGGSAVIPGLTSIRIDPPMATVMAATGAPAMQQFRAFGKKADGREEDVTATANWTVDRTPLVPSIVGGLAKTGDVSGGVVQIQVKNGSILAWAKLSIAFSSVNIADGAGNTPAIPTSPAQPFMGPPDDTRAPQLVYPNDAVVLPPNLNGVEVHFRSGSPKNALFEIAFTNDTTNVRVYTRCVTLQDGCMYKPNASVWRQIAETNRGLGALTVSVRGTDDAGTGVGKSGSIAVSFSKDDLRGALYYWSTTLKSIVRWNFGSTSQTMAETVVEPKDGDGTTCVGCHALSRDGKKMVSTLGGQNDGRILLWDIANKAALAKPFTQQRSQFESWNPDGSQFVGMFGDTAHTGPANLFLFDGNTALKTGEIDLGGLRGDHPDWSADGKRIVFTSVDTAGSYTDQKPQKSGLAYVDKTAAGWSAPVTLLPAVPGKNRFYPAISPTNSFIVFNESTCGSGDTGSDCDADTDPRAMLWSMPLPPGGIAAPTLLARANAPGVNDNGQTALTNTYLKWSPFVFQLDEENQILWGTFSSKRKYGLYPDRGMLYIWMVAVNPRWVGNGDASSTAFCLPFQALDTSNHIAQWTETAVPIIP